MNFNFIFLLLLLGCGVKGDPTTPNNPKLPSLIENYPDIKTDKPLDDTKKRR